ncbi:Xylose isomerase-like TIM barrel [Novipirellula galeiformis]|uniref:Xylose isomerase-like TIM barrel n=1 Tax=Novipirellula galeiformis TaxID=2528004 RepID=A0A5C6CLX0_9BACT|nr:metabolite traffic protein EboE [Novipirellula galeiformis]TWU24146.1 Xylose isomerase-like TIM barrel [Novipirellula galeiformis]
MSFTVGYCTNVHAGMDLPTIRENLLQYAVPVRSNLSTETALGVGLWLPAQAANECVAGGLKGFRAFLDENRLEAFTINGFPYDNFHQDVVKHRVYEPTWWEQERLVYTKQLAVILSELLPASQSVGSISTLPIGWASDAVTEDQLAAAAANLRELAEFLSALESQTGRRIVIAIEPEPGCILDTADDVVQWFSKRFPDAKHRRHLTVCHDVCHSAVMMESQAEVLLRYAAAGITIGKVQVSSAIVADWDAMSIGRRHEAIQQLSGFAEDRYLHQTGRIRGDNSFELAEDLPGLVSPVPASSDPARGDKRWVVHFHVPIFLERFGHLTTSQDDVRECLRTLIRNPSSIDFTGHLEVETYAWTVLPDAMRKRSLAEDVSEELRWLRKELIECM